MHTVSVQLWESAWKQPNDINQNSHVSCFHVCSIFCNENSTTTTTRKLSKQKSMNGRHFECIYRIILKGASYYNKLVSTTSFRTQLKHCSYQFSIDRLQRVKGQGMRNHTSSIHQMHNLAIWLSGKTSLNIKHNNYYLRSSSIFIYTLIRNEPSVFATK